MELKYSCSPSLPVLVYVGGSVEVGDDETGWFDGTFEGVYLPMLETVGRDLTLKAGVGLFCESLWTIGGVLNLNGSADVYFPVLVSVGDDFDLTKWKGSEGYLADVPSEML